MDVTVKMLKLKLDLEIVSTGIVKKILKIVIVLFDRKKKKKKLDFWKELKTKSCSGGILIIKNLIRYRIWKRSKSLN